MIPGQLPPNPLLDFLHAGKLGSQRSWAQGGPRQMVAGDPVFPSSPLTRGHTGWVLWPSSRLVTTWSGRHGRDMRLNGLVERPAAGMSCIRRGLGSGGPLLGRGASGRWMLKL